MHFRERRRYRYFGMPPPAAPLVILPDGLLTEEDQHLFSQYWGELVGMCSELEIAQTTNAHPVIVEDLVVAANMMLHAIRLFLQIQCNLDLVI